MTPECCSTQSSRFTITERAIPPTTMLAHSFSESCWLNLVTACSGSLTQPLQISSPSILPPVICPYWSMRLIQRRVDSETSSATVVGGKKPKVQKTVTGVHCGHLGQFWKGRGTRA